MPTYDTPTNKHRSPLAGKKALLGEDDDAMPPIDQPLPLTDVLPLLTDDMMPLAEHSAPLADYSEHAVCDRRSTSMTHHLPTTTHTPSVVTVRRGIPAVRRPRASPHQNGENSLVFVFHGKLVEQLRRPCGDLGQTPSWRHVLRHVALGVLHVTHRLRLVACCLPPA